jgi:iron complex outermembrane receptor protein
VELSAEYRDVYVRGLGFSSSVTYVDARTLAIAGQASANAPAGSAIGRRLPNIPEWRGTLLVSYRPNARWIFSAGGRYSDKLYSTLDNADVNSNTYQGFGTWFVADLRAQCRIDRRWTASAGVDNVFNRKYFLFHPFPQRTLVVEVKCEF